MDDLLFNSGELRLALEAQAKKMRDAVEAEPEESLKQADADEWAAALAAAADNLETSISTAEPRQAKALLRLLIKDLRVNARSEILPTYRIITPAVCALPKSSGAYRDRTGGLRLANPDHRQTSPNGDRHERLC